MRDIPPNERPEKRIFDRKPDVEVDDELAFHLDQRVRDYVARGMDPAAARAAALERLGDTAQVRHECVELLSDDRRASRRRMWLDDLAQDVKFGLRSARRAPLFSMLAIVTLALGIGANTAIFGVVKSVLLDSLPYRDPSRLTRVYTLNSDAPLGPTHMSAGAARDVSQRAGSFASVTAFRFANEWTYTGADEARVVTVAAVDGKFFTTLGVTAARGRTIGESDRVPNAPATVVLSHEAWQRLFGGDNAAIGRSITLDGSPYTIIGVLPRRFIGPTGLAEFFTPLDVRAFLGHPVGERNARMLGLVGRLTDGTTQEAAGKEIATIATDLAREFPASDAGFTMKSVPLRDDMVGTTKTPLIVVMVGAVLVLLIACTNLAGALLSRTIARRTEFAIRTAIGAGGGRIVRQLLTESCLLAVMGGVAGVAVAVGGLRLIRTFTVGVLPAYASTSLDVSLLAFAFALTLATGLAFGLAPALSVRRAAARSVLNEASRGATETRYARHGRGLLVAAQVALCVSLVTGAALLTRSLYALTTISLGFDPSGVVALQVRLPAARYKTADMRAQFFDQLTEQLRATPGVTSVATASSIPKSLMGLTDFVIEGNAWPSNAQPFVQGVAASDDYFRTMGIALRQGRTFDVSDRSDSAWTVVVSESMARRFWPNGNAIGARVKLGRNPGAQWAQIVGIVADVRNDPANGTPEPMVYSNVRRLMPSRLVLVRAKGDPMALQPAIQRAVAALDKTLPADQLISLETVVTNGLAGRRLPVFLLTSFGSLALLLAGVGVYAMFATMATAREREFGIRVALGATGSGIAMLVLRQAGFWMAAGLALGAAGVIAVSRLVSGLLYGVSPFDPIALVTAAGLLLASGALALIVPVRRAATVDPISVLR